MTREVQMHGRVIKGAIFDIDGTLIDSMPIWNDLGARYLRARGVPPEPGLGEVLYPMTIEEGVRYLKDRYALPESEEVIRAGLLLELDHFYRAEVPIKAGARELVMRLHAAGIPMILASIGDRELEDAALTRLGIREYFRDMLLCEDYHTTKRESVIYLAGARELGLEPQDVVVFEDLLQAVRSARQAGCVTVAIYDAASSKDYDRMAQEADIAVRSLAELQIIE